MLQLTLAYIQQSDHERDVVADLRNRQTLQSATQGSSPAEAAAPAAPAAPTLTTRRAPTQARATTR